MSPDRIRDALSAHRAVIDRIAEDMVGEIERLITVVLDTLGSGGTLFFCGNGGSAADAQHLAAEFVVRFSCDMEAIAALALTTDTSVLTASGNDLGFAHVFERQVRALGRHGDLLVLLSTSGMSENLELAADAAQEAGMRTVALLAKGGGRLRDRVDFALVVPTDSTARAQEAHTLIGHLVCEAVDEAYGGGAKGTGGGSGRASVPDPPEA